MKNRLKKLIILFVVFSFFFIYENYQESNIKNVEETFNQKVIDKIKGTVDLPIDGNLNIYYLNVGQADSILLENNNSYMLIDAGNNADEKNIISYLKNMEIESFDYVIATHAHEDHIGGIDGVIKNFNIDNFYMPDVITTTKTFENVLDALEEKSVAFQTPKIGQIFSFGGCIFEVLYIGNDNSDLNDTSIVVRGVYGDTSFLFMGDATENVEEKILTSNIDSDILKVGHHGSAYSSNLSFLNKVTPKYSIISVGTGNSYEHPASKTISKLEKVGSKVYRTDVDGTIIASSDGKDITFLTSDIDLNG